MSNSIQATILSLITLSSSLAAQEYPPAQPPAPTDAPTADTPSAGSALPEGTIALRRHQILDQQMGGAVSHTMLVPDGWKLDAAPFWTGDPGTLVEFRGTVVGTQGEELTFAPSVVAAFSDNPQIVQNLGPIQNGRFASGAVFAAAPSGPGQAVERVILPARRPGARNIEVLHTEPIEEVNKMLQTIMEPLLQQTEQMNRQSQQMGSGTYVRHWFVAERVIVSYEENGQRYHEEFHISQMGSSMSISGMGFMPDSMTQDWRVLPHRSARAKAGTLEKTMPLFTSIASSVQETPRWHNAVQQIRMDIARAQHQDRMAQIRAMGQAASNAAKTYSEISDMRHESWKKQQASDNRSHRAFVNSIGGVDDYRLPDGGTVSLSSHYNHVFTDGQDRYLFSNNPTFQPNSVPGFNERDWQVIQPVTPSGDAGN